MVLKLSRHHVPMLVLFYNWWAPNVIPFLSAYHRAILDFTEMGANLRYGLIEANETNMESKLYFHGHSSSACSLFHYYSFFSILHNVSLFQF